MKLKGDKKEWAESHLGEVVETAVRGTVTNTYEVLDNGQVKFTVVDDEGDVVGYIKATPPLDPAEVEAQLEAQAAEAAAIPEE